jgi:hypothetical protein
VASNIDHKTCFKCDYEADTAETRCPRCGRPFKSSKNIRVRGGILVFLGAFLILFMGGIAGFVAYLIYGGGIPDAATKFKGEGFKVILIFGIFGCVMLFGLVSLITGIFQLITGRRNQFLVWLMMGLVFLLIISATLTTALLN